MKATVFVFLLMCLFALNNLKSTAQILNPKKVLERKAINKTNTIINKKADQVLDSLVDTKSQPKANEVKAKEVKHQNDTVIKASANSQPALETYSKFDFIPGEKIIFYDDFSKDNVGDFPVLWNTNGSAEVVTSNLFPGKWLKIVGRNSVWTDQLLELPNNYTIEFDVLPIKGENGAMAGYDFRLLQSINAKSFDYGAVPGKAGYLFSCGYSGRPGYRTYINGDEGQGLWLSGYKDDKEFFQTMNQKYHIAIWVQKARVRLYLNANKLFDLPKAFPVTSVKMDRIRFEDGALMFSNVRIAVGNPDMRSKLITEGKLVSYGIYFDVNSDVVKPESYATLKNIADVLKENPDVKILIVGHTDPDGNDIANLDLSKRRAAAVKTELIKSFAIVATRIETDGKGESQPIAPNDSPSNKALNRRVEFVKQ